MAITFEETITCGSINHRGKTDNVFWTTRKFEGSDIIMPTGVAMAMKVLEEEDVSFTLTAKKTKKIVLAFCFNFDDERYQIQ